MKKSSAKIINEAGLHARAASKLVDIATKYCSSIKIGHEKMVDGKSILALMMLAAVKGTVLNIEVEGIDEEQAMNSILNLISTGFGETK